MEEAAALAQIVQGIGGLAKQSDQFRAWNAGQTFPATFLVPIQKCLLNRVKNQVDAAGRTAQGVCRRQSRMAELLEPVRQFGAFFRQGVKDLGQAEAAGGGLDAPDISQRIGPQTFPEPLASNCRPPARRPLRSFST